MDRPAGIRPRRQLNAIPNRKAPVMPRDLNIGMIGYGFMGRAHSNAFRTAPNFFDLPRRPVLKAACGRDAAEDPGLRRHLGLRERRDRLARA